MTERASPVIGLRTGLGVFGAISVAFLAYLLWPTDRTGPPPLASNPLETVKLEMVLSDADTAAFLKRFDQHAPISSQTLRLEAAAAIRAGKDEVELSQLLLRALLSEFQRSALDLRNAHTEDYDRLLSHLRSGLETLAASNSAWCDASQVETLLKQSQADLSRSLIEEFDYDSAAYRWALRWGAIYLETADRARRTPIRHGPRTAYDKFVLQQAGLNLGTEKWALALQIASFSQAEGQGYGEMRQVIDAIDVCQLGIAIDDLSRTLPRENRGRIWAELAPEIFYGNTPYVLALVTDYFFLS